MSRWSSTPPPYDQRKLDDVGSFIAYAGHGFKYRDSCRAVLESVLIGAFSAFETLAGDLWEKMVDERPASAIKSLVAKPGKQEKSIRLSALLKYLRNHHGKMLREEEVVKFSSIGSTREAYVRAFGESGGRPFDREAIRVLELARNLIAHRGGQVDAQFQDDITKGRYSHPFGALRDGVPLRLNGQIVSIFVSEVVTGAADLIAFSGNWMFSHHE